MNDLWLRAGSCDAVPEARNQDMNQTLYKIEEADLVGIPEIDNAHRRIAELCNQLLESYAERSSAIQVHDIFCELREVMEFHFDIEERILFDIRKETHVMQHYVKHRNHHDQLRSLLSHADELIRVYASESLPQLPTLLQKYYFDHIKTLDHEMRGLLRS